MKNIKVLQYIFISTVMLLILNENHGQQKPRHIIAVPGTYYSSYDWYIEINKMKNLSGYLINDVFSPSLFNWNSTIQNQVLNLNKMVNHPDNNYNNILGLGHDVGGLALRGLKEINPKITGLILVGTPNRGSNLLRELNSPDNKNSNFENWVETLELWKGDTDCVDCEKTNKLLKFVRDFKAAKYAEGAMNDPNGYYNSLPDPDPKSTAIIWGNAGNQTLGMLLSNMYGIHSNTLGNLDECTKVVKMIKKAQLKEKEQQEKIDRIEGFFSKILNYYLFKIKDPSLTLLNIKSDVREFIKSGLESMYKHISLSKEVNKLIKETFICDLANLRLEAEWKLRVIGGAKNLKKTEIKGPHYNEQLCKEYSDLCYYNKNSPLSNSFCYYQSIYCPQTIITYETEANDLIYTKTEQTHPNVSKEFEIHANHFREQAYDVNYEKIKLLFDGESGGWFYVPKK